MPAGCPRLCSVLPLRAGAYTGTAITGSSVAGESGAILPSSPPHPRLPLTKGLLSGSEAGGEKYPSGAYLLPGRRWQPEGLTEEERRQVGYRRKFVQRENRNISAAPL